MTISTVFWALLIPLIKDVVPSPGCTSSFILPFFLPALVAVGDLFAAFPRILSLFQSERDIQRGVGECLAPGYVASIIQPGRSVQGADMELCISFAPTARCRRLQWLQGGPALFPGL